MNRESLYRNLREVVNENPPAWAEDKLEAFKYRDIDNFVTSMYWSDSESIKIQDIVGTVHPDYAGRSWLYLLNNGKRMESVNLPLLAENPVYYYEKALKKPTMEYIKIEGNKIFIIEGNHRSCIAKFLSNYQDLTGLRELHGVSLKAYNIDILFKGYFDVLGMLLRKTGKYYSLSVEKTALSRDDAPGWYKEYYDLKAVLELSGLTVKLTANEMEEIAYESFKPFKKLFGKYKHIWRAI
jgi:hypothetical protein